MFNMLWMESWKTWSEMTWGRKCLVFALSYGCGSEVKEQNQELDGSGICGEKVWGAGGGHQQNYDKMGMEGTECWLQGLELWSWLKFVLGKLKRNKTRGPSHHYVSLEHHLEYLAHCLGHSKCSINVGKMNE